MAVKKKRRRVTDAERVENVRLLIAAGLLSKADLRAWEVADVARFIRAHNKAVVVEAVADGNDLR